jgi:hypothetical protein
MTGSRTNCDDFVCIKSLISTRLWKLLLPRETEIDIKRDRPGHDSEVPETWHSNDPGVPRIQGSPGPSCAWQASLSPLSLN